MDTHGDYLPLRSAAELVYRELTGDRSRAPLSPAFVEAALAALSVFATTSMRDGERVIHWRDLQAALRTLRRAGVCFSEVRHF